MRTIWKETLPVNVLTASFTTVIHMPGGSKFIHLAEQHGVITLWFEVYDTFPLVDRKFQIFGTGTGPIGSHLECRGTVLMHDGSLVLHVYEVIGEPLTKTKEE